MGHVESVDIEGFKCLKSVSLECGQFNLITGRNGTGKSSVLEAIELGHDPRFIGRYTDALSHIINISADSASIALQMESGPRKLSLRLADENEAAQAVWDLAEQIRSSHEEVETSELVESIEKQGGAGGSHKISHNIEEIKRDILLIDADEPGYRFISPSQWVSDLYPDSSAKSLEHVMDTNFFGDPTKRGTFVLGEPTRIDIDYIREFRQTKELAEKEESIAQVRVRDFLRDRDIFPNLESFSFDELVFDEDGEQYAIPYDFLGDGTKTIIGIVWQLVADDEIPDVVLLEEPENHLHPGYVKELVPFLIDFAREEDVQLFVTSHNVDFISELLSDSLSEDHREWLAEEFRLIQMTELSPKQFDYDRAKHHTEELHLDLRGL